MTEPAFSGYEVPDGHKTETLEQVKRERDLLARVLYMPGDMLSLEDMSRARKIAKRIVETQPERNT